MTFLNTFILAGLVAVSFPIIIHLFNRRKAKVVEWGAMKFLLDSLVHRKRRVLLEEAVLMALRCLLLAALVLAVARPFSPVQPGVSWLLLLPLILLAAMLLAVTTILARSRRWRWFVYTAAAFAIAAVVMVTQAERVLQTDKWSGGAEQDVAIIIDGSDSMRLEVEGRSNFDRAIDQLRLLLGRLGNEDHVSIIVAGSTPHVITPQPVSPSGTILSQLDELQPVGGTMQVVDAIVAATNSLSRGDHAAKKLVLISDRHKHGWEAADATRWQFVASLLDKLPTTPRVVTRFLDVPRQLNNVALVNTQLSRNVVGTDRPVSIRVTVENTGSQEVEPEGIEYRIVGGLTTTIPVGPIQPGESREVELKHRFEKPGTYAITSRLIISDDLEVDNQTNHVVQVIESLPVLIVDGGDSQLGGLSPTAFLELALAPPADPEQPDEDYEGEPGEAAIAAAEIPTLVRCDVISAPDLSDLVRLDDYQVVILADVGRLGKPAADRLARFVTDGGGLWVLPGGRAEVDFYNQWELPDGRPLLPARLGQRMILADGQDVGISTENVKHVAMQKVVETGNSDLTAASIAAYWQLEPNPADVQTSLGMLLNNGAPLLAERTAGRGRVLLSSVWIGIEDSNLTTLFSFLPMVHELTYHLASPDLAPLNYQQQKVVSFDLSRASKQQPAVDPPETDPPETDPASRLVADVTAPDGSLQQGTVERKGNRLVVNLIDMDQAGIYQLAFPQQLAADIKALRPVLAASDGSYPVPLAVVRDSRESRLELLTESDETAVARHVDYFAAADDEQMIAAVIDEIPGHELWKYLAAAAVLILLAECFVTRWIAVQRKSGAEETVSFVSDGEKLSSFRDRAQQMLETVRTPAGD
jgi:hypothetical protein